MNVEELIGDVTSQQYKEHLLLVIQSVFLAGQSVCTDEWKERIRNSTEENRVEVTHAYLTAIADEMIRVTLEQEKGGDV